MTQFELKYSLRMAMGRVFSYPDPQPGPGPFIKRIFLGAQTCKPHLGQPDLGPICSPNRGPTQKKKIVAKIGP